MRLNHSKQAEIRAPLVSFRAKLIADADGIKQSACLPTYNRHTAYNYCKKTKTQVLARTLLKQVAHAAAYHTGKVIMSSGLPTIV